MCRSFKRIAGVGNVNYIYCWESKGLSDERINSITASNYSVTPNLSYYGTKTRVELDESCFYSDKVTFNYEKVVNIYIAFEIIVIANISKSSSNDSYPTSEKALFGAFNLTKNANIDRYKYSGFGIGFDRRSNFSFPGGGLGKCFWSRYEFINKD